MAGIEKLRDLVAQFQSINHDRGGASWLPLFYPSIDPDIHRTVFRYGNVELQALENYVQFKAETKQALSKILTLYGDEQFMYQAELQKNHLSGDNIFRNLKKLITNAGLYGNEDVASTWHAFETWCELYLEGLGSGFLASYPPAYPFYFKVQRHIWEARQVAPKYLAHPSGFEIYKLLEGKKVLFVTPFADLVNRQHQSGRIKRLFRNFEVPDFSLQCLDAPVTTWPNSPHGTWLETFEHLSRAVEEAISSNGCDVFIASCGCYGIPLCNRVSTNHAINSYYFGNITNFYFGVMQNASKNILTDEINLEMWIKSDLSKFPNVSKIDGGRYV